MVRALLASVGLLALAGSLFAADPPSPRERAESCARLFAKLVVRKPDLPPEIQAQVDLLTEMSRVVRCERLLELWEAAERDGKPFLDLALLQKLLNEEENKRPPLAEKVKTQRATAMRNIQRVYARSQPMPPAGAEDDDDERKKRAAYVAAVEKVLQQRFPKEQLSNREKEWAEELRILGIPADKALGYLTFLKVVERELQLLEPQRKLTPIEVRVAVRLRDSSAATFEAAQFIHDARITD